MAMHDQLTGLANRELLQHRLSQALSSAGRHQRSMALVFLDLDGFKAINDHLGHTTGDSVLEQVSDRLRGVVRRHDDIARFGGDEFVVVCEDTDIEAAVRVAERIRAAIRKPLTGVPIEYPLTASIGVALHHAQQRIRRDGRLHGSARRRCHVRIEEERQGPQHPRHRVSVHPLRLRLTTVQSRPRGPPVDASRIGSQHVDLTTGRGRVEAVLDQPADSRQAPQ
jgi:diguanylate cyclase (GGDEF)-like protein